jgi:hypothetical protein
MSNMLSITLICVPQYSTSCAKCTRYNFIGTVNFNNKQCQCLNTVRIKTRVNNCTKINKANNHRCTCHLKSFNINKDHNIWYDIQFMAWDKQWGGVKPVNGIPTHNIHQERQWHSDSNKNVEIWFSTHGSFRCRIVNLPHSKPSPGMFTI